MTSKEIPLAFQRPLPLTARQPYLTAWAVTNIAALFLRVPFWMLYYIPRGLRQNPNWTWWQSLMVCFGRFNFVFPISMRPEQTAPAKAGGAGGPQELFELIKPIADDKLVGVTSPTETSVRAEARPGNWYPSKYDPATDSGKKIVLYFFGGAYVVGTHVPKMYKGTLDLLLPALGGAKYFGVGYRLASTKGNHFPAQLIDGLSAYTHLLERGILPSNIILLGDSAGAHACLSLVRYLTEHPELNLGLPAAALLESAWIDLSIPIEKLVQHPKYYRDVLPREFLEWGVDAFVPGNQKLTDPYISPSLNPFRAKIPLYVGVDDGEILYESVVEFARRMKAVEGNDVTLDVHKGGCHATFMFGEMIGFGDSAKSTVEAMKAFLEERRIL